MYSFVEETKTKKLRIKNLISKYETNKIKFPEQLAQYVDFIEKTKNVIFSYV